MFNLCTHLLRVCRMSHTRISECQHHQCPRRDHGGPQHSLGSALGGTPRMPVSGRGDHAPLHGCHDLETQLGSFISCVLSVFRDPCLYVSKSPESDVRGQAHVGCGSVWPPCRPFPQAPSCLCSCVSDMSRHIKAPPGVRRIRGQPQPCADAGRGYTRAVTCSLAKSLNGGLPRLVYTAELVCHRPSREHVPSPQPSWMEGEPRL